MNNGTKVFVLLALVGGLSACAAPVPESAERARLSQEEVLAEYLAETFRLELAANDTWVTAPPELALDSPDPARPMLYEEGVGAQTAQFQWYCSWGRQALAGTDPTPALERLREFPSMGVWNDMDSNGRTLFTQILEAATAGDQGPLADYLSEFCQQMGR